MAIRLVSFVLGGVRGSGPAFVGIALPAGTFDTAKAPIEAGRRLEDDLLAKDVLPISVIIMTKNEERVIERTIRSVRRFGQVFVVDSNSVDRTVEIVRASSAELVPYEWDGKYPKKKEWALANLPFKYDWVLYLDADEAVEPELVHELGELFRPGRTVGHAAFDVDLDYYFLGRPLRHGHKVTKRVLVDRRRTTWPRVDDLDVTTMWEVEGHYQPNVDGSIGKLRSKFVHDDRDPLFDYFARHNRYSDWEAHIRTRGLGGSASDPNRHRSRGGRTFARVPAKPAVFFLYSYLLRLGFLDGAAGFHYAMAHAFYFWQIGVKEREIVRARKGRFRGPASEDR